MASKCMGGERSEVTGFSVGGSSSIPERDGCSGPKVVTEDDGRFVGKDIPINIMEERVDPNPSDIVPQKKKLSYTQVTRGAITLL